MKEERWGGTQDPGHGNVYRAKQRPVTLEAVATAATRLTADLCVTQGCAFTVSAVHALGMRCPKLYSRDSAAGTAADLATLARPLLHRYPKLFDSIRITTLSV